MAAEGTLFDLTGQGLIDLYAEVTAGGGNLLVNVGPRADGSIPQIQSKTLLALGRSLEPSRSS